MDLSQFDDALSGQDITGTDVVAALFVLLVGTGIAFLAGRLIGWYFGRPGRQSQQVAKQVARAGRWLIQLAAIGWAMGIVGFDLDWVLLVFAALLVVGVLAAKPLVESMAVSTIVTSRPVFQIGNEIEVGEHRGEVVEVTTRSLVLRLKDGSRLHIPTTELLEGSVRVFSSERPRRSSIELSIPFSVEVDEAEQLIVGAVADLDGVVPDPPVSVVARGFDNGTDLTVRLWHEAGLSEGTGVVDRSVRAIRRALADSGIGTAVTHVEVDTQSPA